MHPHIAAFPSVQSYDGRLRNAACVTHAASYAPWVRGHCDSWLGPWSFIDVSRGREERRPGGSLANVAEAEAISRTLCWLRDQWRVRLDSSSSVKVLTFYSAQVAQLRSVFAAAGLRGVFVATVDGAQGAEADVVMLSLVRANAGGRIGFVTDARRLNVAVSRAKQALLMFGHARTLLGASRGDVDHVSALMRAAEARGVVFPESAIGADVAEWERPGAVAAVSALVARGEAARAASRVRPEGAGDASTAIPLRSARCQTVADHAAPRMAPVELAARVAELEEFERHTRRALEDRAAKRRSGVQQALAPFAPPMFRQVEDDG